MKALLVLIGVAISLPALAVCEDVHGPGSPKVTLGSPGAETLANAYKQLLQAGGGVIEVPPGEYQCESLFYVPQPTRKLVDLTIRGISDDQGKRPLFRCREPKSGTFVSFGGAVQRAGVPNPQLPIQFALENVEVDGYNIHLNIWNVARAVIKNSHLHHASGTGVKNTQRLGDQKIAWEICDNEFDHSGSGNMNHALYLHGGLGEARSTLVFMRNHCHHARGSHCAKFYTNDNVVLDNVFENLQDEGKEFWGTEVLDIGSCNDSLIDGNTFVSWTRANDIIYFLNRRDQVGCPRPWYGSEEFNDPTYWKAVTEAGIDDTLPDPASVANPYIAKHFISNNKFVELRTPGPHDTYPRYPNPSYAVGNYGSYPGVAPKYYSYCVDALPIPAGWVERTRVYVWGNRLEGYLRPDPYNKGNVRYCDGVTPKAATPGPIVIVDDPERPKWFRRR